MYRRENFRFKCNNQNPREASSRSRIFLISLVFVCFCVFIYLCTYSHWPYLKTSFFFEKTTMTTASLEKLPCHVDFPHIFSLPLVLTKSRQVLTWLFDNQNRREASNRSRIFLFSLVCICLSVFWLVFTGPPDQTKNDTDLKFLTLPGFLFFSKKLPWARLASKKLPHHVDFS